jgi:signal transduction histidine kinase
MSLIIQKSYLSKVFSLILLFEVISGSIHAQQSQILKLKAQLKAHKLDDTAKVDLLANLAFAFRLVHPDSTQKYGQESLELAKKLSYDRGIANALSKLAISSYNLSNYQNALKYNKESLIIFRNLNDKIGEASVLNNIAIIYHSEGNFDPALSLYQQSLLIRKENNDQRGVADCYNNIGNIYVDKGNYTLALENLYKGLQIRETLKDSENIANSYGNISGVYYSLKKFDDAYLHASKAFKIQTNIGDIDGAIQSSVELGAVSNERKDYQKALSFFYQSKDLAIKSNHIDGLATSLINIGEVFNTMNQPDSALHNFTHSLKLCIASNDQPGRAFCEIGIGRSYQLKKDFKQAINHLQIGFNIANQSNNKLNILEASKYLGEVFEKNNNPQMAIKFNKIFLQYKDSIFNEETNRKTHEIEFNYLLQKKQNEITLLEKDQSIQKANGDFQRLITIALLILVVMLVAFVYFINKYRVKEVNAKKLILNHKSEIENQAQNLKALNLYKDKTFSILSHDLRNPISSLTNVVELMDQNVLNEEDFSTMRKSFRNQLRSINILLDNTLNWAKSQMNGELTPQKTIVSLNAIVDRNFDLFSQNALDKNITLNKKIEAFLSLIIDENHLDIILRNIIFNAIKFSHPNTEIWVKAFVQDKNVIIQITDQGKGMSPDILNSLFTYHNQPGTYGTKGERGAGIGLVLTKDFIARNHGEISVTSTENIGSEFTISFPKN